MTLTPQWLDELRARTTLSTLIGKTVKVQKAGREYKACCPFHNEKTPSFTINDEKGFYHCFGCGAHGDAIRWMTDQRGLPFMDAVKELAAGAGMDVPAPDPRAARRAEKQASLHDVMGAAQDWFVAQKDGIEGVAARAYLRRRGISEQTERAFGFGFAPDARGKLRQALKDQGEDKLIEVGLLIDPDGERDPYDRFRGRLMLPIRDPRGRVIAFGGRILGEGEPKYLNSPDTPLFDKGRTLYNLDRAAPAARKSGRIIVVEGYMDVIALAQAGFAECVAPLGTALTEAQIERLWTMVETPILCFDGDNAGQKAAMRAAMRALPLLRPGHSLRFVTMPPGQDPDDLIRAGGPKAFAALLESPESLLDRLWNHLLAEAPLDTPEERAGLKQRLADRTAEIQHPDIRQHYAQAFRERYDALFFRRPEGRFDRGRGGPPGGGRAFSGGRFSRFQPPHLMPPVKETVALQRSGMSLSLLRAVLTGLILYPGEITRHMEALGLLEIPDTELADLLRALIDAAVRHRIVETDALLTILEETNLYNRARGLVRANALSFTFTRKTVDTDRARRDLEEVIGFLVARPEIEAALQQATDRMAAQLDNESFAQQQKLLAVRNEHDRRLADLMQPDDA